MKNYEVIKEGLAKARFGLTAQGVSLPGTARALKLAAGGGGENGGLNPEEFLVRPWRLLSMAMTPYRFFDFTKDGVLAAAVSLFDGLTLYANHNADVNSWKGYVAAPRWDDENEPAGINADLVIDRTVDPTLARGVEIKALRSASVTIWFEYERSHPELRGFYDYLGEEVDGEIVRFVITRITQAGEVSIVWEGEDPFAKSLSAGHGPDGKTNKPGGDTVKIKGTLAKRLGLAETDDVTPEALVEKVKSELAALDAKVGGLEDEAKLGKQLLTETRQRAVTLYKALKGEKAVGSFISGVIEKADLETARAMCEEYQGDVEKQIPLTCPKCGEKLSRRSSLETGGDGDQYPDRNINDYKV